MCKQLSTSPLKHIHLQAIRKAYNNHRPAVSHQIEYQRKATKTAVTSNLNRSADRREPTKQSPRSTLSS